VPVFFEDSNEFHMSLKCAEDNPPLISDLEEVAHDEAHAFIYYGSGDVAGVGGAGVCPGPG
jgi:hypothetical protein